MMAAIQLWFIQLLTGPLNPMWGPYIGSSVVVLIALIIIGGILCFIQGVFDWFWDLRILWFFVLIAWALYLIFAAVFLFGNWGGLSVS